MEQNDIFGISLAVILIVLGLLMLFGAIKKWRFIVDPPEGWWFFYTQSFVKKFFGQEVLIPQTYFWGILGILSGLYILYETLI